MFKGLQLAEHIKSIENKSFLYNGNYIAEPKINGCRCEINGEGVFSRYGNKWMFDSESTKKLINFLKSANIALDGEMDTNFTDENGNLLEHNERRLRTMSVVKTQPISKIYYKNIVFWVFDIIVPDNVFSLKERKEYLERIIDTLNYLSPFTIRLTPFVVLNSEKELNIVFNFFVKKHGYEGLMFKKLNALYKNRRTDDWLAYKVRHTSDLPIIRVETGKVGKKNETRCGSLVVKTPRGEAEIGTGFSDEQREWFYNNKDNIEGIVVEIEHEGFANATGDLINASFVCIRDDKPKWEMSF